MAPAYSPYTRGLADSECTIDGGMVVVAYGASGETSLFAVTAPSLEGTTGKYFEGTSPKPVNSLASDPAARAKLWALTEKLIDAH